MEVLNQLRVYEPLTALPEQLREQAVLDASRDRREVEAQSAHSFRQRLFAPRARHFPDPDTPEVFRVITHPRGETLYCPEELALRTVLAVHELEGHMPPEFLDMIIPEQQRVHHEHRTRIAEAQLAPRGPLDRPHTLTHAWTIPVAWFLLCGDGDDIHTGNRPITGTFTAARQMTLAQALERGQDAATTLTVYGPRWNITNDILQLVGWLQQFHPDSTVELEYGDVARWVWPDDSVTELRVALEALSEGEMATAVDHYELFMRRWFGVQARSVAS